jgi:hypothetical protein
MAVVALTAAGGLFFLFLRQQGHGEAASLVVVAAFGLSEPVRAALDNFFLAEPVGIVLLLLLLVALEAGSLLGAGAVLAVGGLTKEIFILLLPSLYFAGRRGRSSSRALASATLAGLPALFVFSVLRYWWAPQAPRASSRLPSTDQLLTALGRGLLAWPDWLPPLIACGLPLALLGAVLPEGRIFLRRYAYPLFVTLAVPFAAAIYTGEDEPAGQFFFEDVPRLLLYALPLLLSLCLVALRRLGGRGEQPLPDGPATFPSHVARHRALRVLSAIVAVLALVFPFLALDRYRRADLRGIRDGGYVLAFCRDSLRLARELETGRVVPFEPFERRFSAVRSDRHHLERMRWFLREGWGPLPQYGMAEAVMQADEAAVVLPSLRPRDLNLVTVLRSARPLTLEVGINGQPAGQLEVDTRERRRLLRLPAERLFRGDNRLTLRANGAARAEVSLLALNLRAVER